MIPEIQIFGTLAESCIDKGADKTVAHEVPGQYKYIRCDVSALVNAIRGNESYIDKGADKTVAHEVPGQYKEAVFFSPAMKLIA